MRRSISYKKLKLTLYVTLPPIFIVSSRFVINIYITDNSTIRNKSDLEVSNDNKSRHTSIEIDTTLTREVDIALQGYM